MGTERFIRFDAGKAPSAFDVFTVAEDYLGGFIKKEFRPQPPGWPPHSTAVPGTWVIDLHGTHSWPFRRMPLAALKDAGVATSAIANAMAEFDCDPRCMELVVTDAYINVITRNQDMIVNAVADRFAKLCAKYWSGWLDTEAR